MMSFKKINLNCLIIIGLFVLNLSISKALRRTKRGFFQCSNIVVNSNFVEHTILYKDNVNTVSECCEFCNSNLACTVWTLQLDIGRCLLKSQKGARVVDAGFISGFSDRYASTLSTPIPHTTTTTLSTTISPVTQTSTLTLTSETKNPITKCQVLSGYSFGKSAMNQASNVSLTICCDFCAEFNICKSYTYFTGNKTCLLFDEINLTPIKCADQDQCESGRIFMDFQSTPLPTLSPTSSQEYVQVYSFYSMFDRFQLKFSNLINDYFFLNNLPLTELNQIEFLKNTIHHLEYSIKENIGVFMQNRIKRVIIDNMAYLPSTRSIVVSFIVIMEPDLQDINEGNSYLSIFNSLIANRIGFGNIKFYNESLSRSDLLPSVSQFSLKFVNINDISLLSFERIAISPFTSTGTTNEITSVTTISQTTTLSTMTSSSTTSSSTTTRSSSSTIKSTTTTTTSTTTATTSTTTTTTSTTTTTTSTTTATTATTSTTTATTSTTTATTSTTTTTTSTTTATTSTTTTTTSTTTATTSTTTTTTSTTTTTTSTTTTTTSTTTATTSNSTSTTINVTIDPTNHDSLSSTMLATSTNENNTIFTSLAFTTLSTENQTTLIDDNFTTLFFETTSTQFFTSQFDSLVDLSTQLSELDRCWIELSTFYIGENLGEYIITSIDECCRACQLNSECQSWVYHNLDQTCQLKKSLRSTYFITNDYTSGFLKRPYDTFIKVSNSLGLTNSNQTTFDNIKENIFNLWFRYLFSNINRISDSFESEEFIYDNKLIQVVTYLLQLDPRISQNSQILMKLVNKVNSTLCADPDFYNPIVANLTTDNEIVAYVLPSTQISVIEIFQNQSHVTDEEAITSSIPKVTTEFMTSADQTLTSSQQSQIDMTSLSSTTPLTTSFEIAAYQSGNCFIETNVNYISESAEDDLISFYTQNKERCCLSCNRLEMCRSWSFETTSQTCVLKAGYRSNPTVEPNYESGFKPSDLFTLSVTRGLEFVNLNNSIYDFLLNYTIESGFGEREIYLLIKTRLEQNILEILTENENVTFIRQILITNLFYNISSLLVDYDVNIDPRFNERITDILFLMNDLYATPNKSDKEFLRLKLPLENEDESGIIVRVPETTSQFKIIATNTSFFQIETTTSLATTPINLDQYSKYLGCFNDKTTDRDLAYSESYPTAENGTYMTIAYCIDLCRSLNQAYAGLQFGQECFCGNSYGKHGETDKKDCFITCAGDRDSTCGGFLKNAVYSVGLYYTTELKTSTELISTQEFSLPSIFTFETSAQPSSTQTSISSTTLAIEFFTTSTVESTNKPITATTNDFFKNITTTYSNESTAHEVNTTFVSSFSTLSDTSSLFETTTASSTNLITSLETEHSTNTDPITSISLLSFTNASKKSPDFSTLIPITTQNSTEQEAKEQTNEAREPLGTTTESFVTSDRILSDSTSLIGLTGPTLLVSTSSGIISPRPIVSNPSAFLITEIKVDKEIDRKSEEFRTKLTDGLEQAYTAAFRRTNSLYYSQESAAVSGMDIQVNLVNVTFTGDTNSDKTKNILQLRYYILSGNELVSSEYAADSINLLSDQEMARYLNYEIQNQGYVEIKPRDNVQTDQKLWIIAAVLGPLLIFFILIWIILFVYYKCINPRPNNIKHDKNDTSEDSKDGKNLSDESLINVNENVKQTPAMKSGKIEPLVESPGPNDDNFLINDTTKAKKKKKDNLKLPDLNQNRIVPNPDLVKSEDENFSDYQVEDSIKQKAEAEKWRNKQRNREKNNIKTENETTRRKRPGKKISPSQSENSDRLSPVGTDKKSYQKPETKSQVSILTNSSDILHNNLNNLDNPPVIVSEFSKPYQPHVPVKVHVNNKPTVEDTTRVYNPYPFQNEYERYFKNGFLFEPVESTREHQQSTVNANAKFTSDLISPYNRKDNSIHFKNYASNDKLLDYARESKVGFGEMNIAFKDDSESEFKNLNNLKNKTPTKGAELYEDELDLINKYKKNSENNYSTYELVDSINQELKNLKSGYKPNGSNA